MSDNNADHELPDFGPDDDTEEMHGIPIYRPDPDRGAEFPDWDSLPEFPLNFHLGREDDKIYYKDAIKE